MDVDESGVKLFGARVVMTSLSFFGIAYFSQQLGSAQMGIFFLFQMLLGVLQIPAGFGINDALEKRASSSTDATSIFATAVVLKALPLAAVVGSILLFESTVNNYVGADVARLLAVALVLQEYAELLVKLINSELRVGETAHVRLVHSVVWFGFGVVLLGYGLGVRGLIYASIVGFGAMFTLGLYRRQTQFGTPSRKHARSLVGYARYAFVDRGGQYVHNWMDVAIIGFFLAPSAVGAYEVAWRVASLPMLLTTTVAIAVFPKISSLEEHPDRIGRTLSNTFVPGLVLVVPSFFGIVALSREILSVLFGPEFGVAQEALIILMAGNVIGTFDLLMTRGLWAVDRPDITAKITVVSTIVNVSLNLFLVQVFGILGGAIATSVAVLVGTLLTAYNLQKQVSIQIPTREIGWCVFSSAIMFGVVEFAKNFTNVVGVLELTSVIGIGVMAYWGVLLTNSSLRTRVNDVRESVLSG